MTHATLLWSIWQALLRPFACGLHPTRPPPLRRWITALALNVEEHTITQSVLAIERPADWKAMETFAEYGAWHRRRRHPHPGPAWSRRPPAGSGTATTSRPSMTPRSTAPANTSGAPAPSTSTPPAAPTGPPPSGRTTGSSSGRCSRTPTARLVPAALRAALLPQVAVAPPVRVHRPDGGVPDQVRTGRRTAPGAGPHPRRPAPGRSSTAASR